VTSASPRETFFGGVVSIINLEGEQPIMGRLPTQLRPEEYDSKPRTIPPVAPGENPAKAAVWLAILGALLLAGIFAYILF